MPRPPSKLGSNFNQSDSQDQTQLTAGGSPAAGEFKVGDLVGGAYEILAMIGSGGMGHVYRVRHTMMNQVYALKTLSAEQVNELAWRRFQNEAQAIARMSHPNIVGIYNLGLHEGRLPFYVMDLVEGRTLMDLLRQSGPPGLHETLSIFSEVAAGMGYAHRKGIVHRDLKPPNILLLSGQDNTPGSPRVKIVDFGIAKLSGIKDKANQGLTSVGEICGSPYYMSPEQCEGGRVDTRSDIYSFGCTLFETLTGEPPFKGRNAVETMLMHQTAKPPSLYKATGKKYPQMLEQALATMLAKAPMDRYQNMERIVQDFNTILEGKEEAIRPYVSQLSDTHILTQKIQARKKESQQKTAAGPLKKLALGGLSLAVAAGLAAGSLALYKMLTPTSASSASTHFTELFPFPKSAAAASSAGSPVKAVSLAAAGAPTQLTIKKAASTQPYSHEEVRDGRRILCFDFPPGLCLGMLRTYEKNENRPAKGHLEYPAGVQLEFVPDESVLSDSDCLSHFRKGDIYKVMFASDTATNEMIRTISKIKGLKELNLRGCVAISDGALPYIKQMTNLEELRLELTDITGKGLATVPFLKQLHRFHFCSGTNGDDVCAAIKGSDQIQELYLDGTPIGYPGVKAIGTLKNLDTLEINTTRLDDAGLKELAKIPHLKTIYALNCGITAKQVPVLRTFPSLKVFSVHSFTMSQSEAYKIQRGLPGVSVQ